MRILWTFVFLAFCAVPCLVAAQEKGDSLNLVNFDDYKQAVMGERGIEIQAHMLQRFQKESGYKLMDDMDYPAFFSGWRDTLKRDALCSGITEEKADEVIKNVDIYLAQSSDSVERMYLMLNKETYLQHLAINDGDETGTIKQLREGATALSMIVAKTREELEQDKTKTCAQIKSEHSQQAQQEQESQQAQQEQQAQQAQQEQQAQKAQMHEKQQELALVRCYDAHNVLSFDDIAKCQESANVQEMADEIVAACARHEMQGIDHSDYAGNLVSFYACHGDLAKARKYLRYIGNQSGAQEMEAHESP